MKLIPIHNPRYIIGFRGLSLSSIKSDSVGPPHPVSNLRPVLYDKEPPTEKSLNKFGSIESARWHPYSIDEFDGDIRDIQWKMERQRLDNFNHSFWIHVRSVHLLISRMIFIK